MFFSIVWIVLIITTGVLASRKRRNVLGWVLLSILIAPIVNLILLALPPANLKNCTHCAEAILEEATLCRYCGREQVNV